MTDLAYLARTSVVLSFLATFTLVAVELYVWAMAHTLVSLGIYDWVMRDELAQRARSGVPTP